MNSSDSLLLFPGMAVDSTYDHGSLMPNSKENLFFGDRYSTPEVRSQGYGVAGDPVPQTLHGNSIMSSFLLLCLVVSLVLVSRSREFLFVQLKDFFYIARTGKEVVETSLEVRLQVMLTVMAAIMMAVPCYIYITENETTTFVVDNNYQLFLLLIFCFLGFFLFKTLLYLLVNPVFFEPRQCKDWLKSQLFIYALLGLLLIPVVLVHVYFDLELTNVVFFYNFVLTSTNALTFYKCFCIFFKQNGGFLQTFLYFCTLEIAPVLMLIGGMMVLTDNLKLNF